MYEGAAYTHLAFVPSGIAAARPQCSISSNMLKRNFRAPQYTSIKAWLAVLGIPLHSVPP